MHNSNNNRLLLFAVMITGFYMIIQICLFTKYRSHPIDNNTKQEFYIQDTIAKKIPEKDEILNRNEDQAEYPNKGKAWRIERSYNISF
jgi:hypothetical protein